MDRFVDIALQILSFFYAIGWHNYGLAIIFLTVAIKIALYPLTLQSTQSMIKMQAIQPKFDELKKKHKDNSGQFQKEIMELYKKHGVNPLGGCLPLLIQIPVFISLFMALTSEKFKLMVASSGASASFLWIRDISIKDTAYPFSPFILPLLIGITTYWSQKTMPSSSGNDQMKQMMLFMPIFISFISIEFAAGVQIYWIAQNLLTVGQQVYISKYKGKV